MVIMCRLASAIGYPRDFLRIPLILLSKRMAIRCVPQRIKEANAG